MNRSDAFFLNIIKPPGMSSHDVVNAVRRNLGTARVGHAGTLDPAAAGVLPLGVGAATRLLRFVAEGSKDYRFEMTFGVETTTHDSEGEVVRESDASWLDEGAVAAALGRFAGEFEQVVPAVSAVRVGGERLYRLAREGRATPVPSRKVRVFSADLLRFLPGRRPRALVHVSCSKGTYVRAICRDVGRLLGCGAYVSFLLRTRVGSFAVGDAFALEEMWDRRAKGLSWFTPVEEGLSILPEIKVGEKASKRIADGIRPGWQDMMHWPDLREGDWVRLSSASGKVLAVGRVLDSQRRKVGLEVVLPREGG